MPGFISDTVWRPRSFIAQVHVAEEREAILSSQLPKKKAGVAKLSPMNSNAMLFLSQHQYACKQIHPTYHFQQNMKLILSLLYMQS